MDIDPQTKIVLDKIENLLKDRFNGYVLVASDGEDVYHLFSSQIFAKGSSSYLETMINNQWCEED